MTKKLSCMRIIDSSQCQLTPLNVIKRFHMPLYRKRREIMHGKCQCCLLLNQSNSTFGEGKLCAVSNTCDAAQSHIWKCISYLHIYFQTTSVAHSWLVLSSLLKKEKKKLNLYSIKYRFPSFLSRKKSPTLPQFNSFRAPRVSSCEVSYSVAGGHAIQHFRN